MSWIGSPALLPLPKYDLPPWGNFLENAAPFLVEIVIFSEGIVVISIDHIAEIGTNVIQCGFACIKDVVAMMGDASFSPFDDSCSGDVTKYKVTVPVAEVFCVVSPD